MTKASKDLAIGTVLSGVALLASAPANAELIITETQVVINDGFEYIFDVNGDETNDFVIRVGADEKLAKSLANQTLLPGLSETEQRFGSAEIRALGEGRRIFRTDSGLKSEKELVLKFAEGDDVDGSVGKLNFGGTLYKSFFSDIDDDVPQERQFTGPFANVGDRGFVGFEIRQFDLVKQMEVSTEEDSITNAMVKEERILNYGWVELVRGSINLVRVGFQTTPGAAAPIPGVTSISEPATLPLIALGAAGLVALRRRKAQHA